MSDNRYTYNRYNRYNSYNSYNKYNGYNRYNRYPYRRRYTPVRYNPNNNLNQVSPYNKVHMVKRLGAVNQGTGNQAPTEILNNGQFLQFNFMLARVAGNSDFINLYNEYKIRAVKVSFIPLANVSNMQSSAYSNLIYSAIDTNDFPGTSLSLTDLRQYNTAKWSPYNRIHSRYFYPRVNLTTPEEGSTTPNSLVLPGEQPWISTNDSGARYHSLLVIPPVIDGIDATDPIYRIECTYYLSFRGTR